MEKPVFLNDAEIGRDYYGELRWWDKGGEDRRPAYRVRIVDKNLPGGKVKLDRELMGSRGVNSTAWDEVEHPAEDLFLYEMPYEPTGPGPVRSGTSGKEQT